jgi:hypothetical protein
MLVGRTEGAASEVSQTFASWNQIGHVLRRLEAFRSAAGSAYGAIHISKGP